MARTHSNKHLPNLKLLLLTIDPPTGYNGDYSGGDGFGMTATMEAKRNFYGENRTDDNMPWALPENIVPHRFYVGAKGYMEDGSPAPPTDFLARNGLRYGQIYGFAIDMTETGPTGGRFRDTYHVNATNGQSVSGRWVAQPWRWNGTVVDFEHDGSWDWQQSVPGFENYKWWNAAGYDKAGAKTEHLSPVRSLTRSLSLSLSMTDVVVQAVSSLSLVLFSSFFRILALATLVSFKDPPRVTLVTTTFSTFL